MVGNPGINPCHHLEQVLKCLGIVQPELNFWNSLKNNSDDIKKTMTSSSLEQFFTSDSLVKACLDVLQNVVREKQFINPMFIEPSVGSQSFFKQLPSGHRKGFEIDPQFCNADIVCQDFLTVDRKQITTTDVPLIFIGNP